MSDIIHSIYDLRQMDELSRMDSAIHRLHPLVKLLATISYLIIIVSYNKYEISALLPLVIYPVLLMTIADIPVKPIFKKMLIIEPLIIGIGILNPIFTHQRIVYMGVEFSIGWLTFLSIFIKGGFTVLAALILISTTSMEQIARALRILRVPKLFVLQLMLTYRYISVLMEEVLRTWRAYSLRAPKQKGVHRSVWGSLLGQLLLRTFDRAERIYDAMRLRGFNGDYNTGIINRFRLHDFIYLVSWVVFFSLARVYNIPEILGLLLTGGR